MHCILSFFLWIGSPVRFKTVYLVIWPTPQNDTPEPELTGSWYVTPSLPQRSYQGEALFTDNITNKGLKALFTDDVTNKGLKALFTDDITNKGLKALFTDDITNKRLKALFTDDIINKGLILSSRHIQLYVRSEYGKMRWTELGRQFSSLTDWVVGAREGRGRALGTIQQRSSSGLFCRRPLWTALAWKGMSSFWCCPSNISSADHGVAHPSRCPEGWFWRGCRGVWHARTMQASVSWQLPELWTHKEVDLSPHLVVDLVLQVGDTEKFPHALVFQSLDDFFLSQHGRNS